MVAEVGNNARLQTVLRKGPLEIQTRLVQDVEASVDHTHTSKTFSRSP